MSVLSVGSNASSHLSILQERVNQLHNRVINLTSEKESRSQVGGPDLRLQSLLEKYAEKYKLRKTNITTSDSVSSEILPLKKRKKRKKKRIKKGKLLGNKSKLTSRSSSSSRSSHGKGEKRSRKPLLPKTKKNCHSKSRRSSKRKKPKIRSRSVSHKPVTKKKRKVEVKLAKNETRSMTKSQNGENQKNQIGLTEEYLRRIDIWDGWKAYKERIGSKNSSSKCEVGKPQSIPSQCQNETKRKVNEVFSELTSLPEDSMEEIKIAKIEKLNEIELKNQMVSSKFSNFQTSKKDNSSNSSISVSTSTNTDSRNKTRNIEIQTEVREEEKRSESNISSNFYQNLNEKVAIRASTEISNTRSSTLSTCNSVTGVIHNEEVPIKIRICNVMKDENDLEFQKVEVCVTKKDGISQKLDLIIPTARRNEGFNNNRSKASAEESKLLPRGIDYYRSSRRGRRKKRKENKGIFRERRTQIEEEDEQQKQQVEHDDGLLMNSFDLKRISRRKDLSGEEEEEDAEEDVVMNDITHNSSILSNDGSLDSSFDGSTNIMTLKKLMKKYSDMK